MPGMPSAVSLLLDTHIWVRYINGAPTLKPATVNSIDNARRAGSAFVSVISIWEIALLVRKKRLDLPFGVERWVQRALELPGIQLLPFTPQIAIESVQLPDSLNKDPSDRILVATSRIQNLTLMTRDKDIIRFAKQTNLSLELA
jgi:PIN domain nuclease of toxin-antitoxin system